MLRADVLRSNNTNATITSDRNGYVTIDRRSTPNRHSAIDLNRSYDEKKQLSAAFNEAKRSNAPVIKVDVTKSPRNDEMRNDGPMYGQLVVVGYNGPLPHAAGRYKTILKVRRRPAGNNFKPVRQLDLDSPEAKKIISEHHTTTYYSKTDPGALVQYGPDIHRDMYQIGRSAENPVDFIVMDTVPGAIEPSDTLISRSTISRFACRLVIERRPPHHVRVFGACFDPNKRIYLGDAAPKWKNQDGTFDGLTTNGVYIMHPQGPWGRTMKTSVWREVSVSGRIFSLRGNRSSRDRGEETSMETNVLMDGSMLDLCGVTLLWRTPAGLKNAPSFEDLQNKREELNAKRMQCPVGLTTLRFPSNTKVEIDSSTLPHVYMTCGHVHGFHVWGIRPSIDVQDVERSCPICRKMSPFMQLKFGMEPLFYLDNGPATHAFTPCGHVTTEATVRYWSSVPIPHGKSEFPAVCPFCAVQLQGQGFVKLIFQTE